MSCNYFAPEVKTGAVNEYFRKSAAAGNDIHAVEVYVNNKPMIKVAPAPYSLTEKQELYSLSKSFASTAFGIAYDKGLIKPEDRLVDIFPDKVPENPDPHLFEMTMANILSMNSGHETCVMPRIFFKPDPVAEFMAQPIPYKPGTHFAYNTGATCVVTAAIERVTGMSAMDWLQTYFFEPLEFENMRWNTLPSGLVEGGIGMQASADDLAKFGLFYLNRGVWNGKRYLSEEWIDRATAYTSDNSCNGSPDWTAGYGYQFWLNSKGGFRGDGAFGQLCIVLPHKNTVIAVLALVNDMQKEINDLMELIDTMLTAKDEPLECFDKPVPHGCEFCGKSLEGSWKCDKNIQGITSVHIKTYRDKTVLDMVFDGRESQRIVAGKDLWVKNEIRGKWLRPKLLDLMNASAEEKISLFVSAYPETKGFTLACKQLSTPHSQDINFFADGDRLSIIFGTQGYIAPEARKISAERIRF